MSIDNHYLKIVNSAVIDNLDDVSYKILRFIYDAGTKLKKKHGTVQHITAQVGYPYMKVYNSLSALIENGLIIKNELDDSVELELHEQVKTYFERILDDTEEACDDEKIKAADNKYYTVNESEKSGAVYELVNDTLKKTIDFCQSLILELDSNRNIELLKKLRDNNNDLTNEINRLNKELKDAEQLLKYHYAKLDEIKQYCEAQMNYLISSVDDKANSFFELIVWAQQQNRSKFISDLLNEIREARDNMLNKF